MRKFLTFALLAFLPFFASAQYAQDFTGCPADGIVTKASVLPMFGTSSDALQAYFSEKLQPIVDNQSPTGHMELRVIIDQEGTPCLSSLSIPDGGVRIEPNHIKNIVDGMQGWKAATVDGRPVVYQAFINLQFQGDKVVTQLMAK